MAFRDYSYLSIIKELELGASFWYHEHSEEVLFITLQGSVRNFDKKTFQQLLDDKIIIRDKKISDECYYYVSTILQRRLDEVNAEKDAVYEWLKRGIA